MEDQSRPEAPRYREALPRPNPPVFNLPTSLLASLLLIWGIFGIETFLLPDWLAEQVILTFGFIPVRYVYPLSEQGYEWIWSPVTYSLLHGGLEHIGFNSLWLAAFGAPVVRRIGTVRFIVFWVLSAAASAAFYVCFHWGEPSLMVGASGVISALMGAACRFAFPPQGKMSRGEAHLNPRLSIFGAFSSRMVVIFTAAWLFGNLLFVFGIPIVDAGAGGIAWEAHIGGYLFGFLLFAAFDPRKPMTTPLADAGEPLL